MTRRDYILNHFATKFATDYPQAGEGEDQSLLDAQETVNAQNAPVSLKDRLLQRLGGAKQFTAANPVASTAVGVGTLSALVAAVLSKKGKRLRNAGIAGVAGAAAGAGGGAAIGANRKRRSQQAAAQQQAARQAALETARQLEQEAEQEAALEAASQLEQQAAEEAARQAEVARRAEQDTYRFTYQPKAPYSEKQ